MRHEALCVSRGGERASWSGRRSCLIELGAARSGERRRGWQAAPTKADVPGLPDGAGSSSMVRRYNVRVLVFYATIAASCQSLGSGSLLTGI